MALKNFIIADRRLYLTADKKELVEHGDPRARSLYAPVGTRIPIAMAQRYGLLIAEEAEPTPLEELARKAEERAEDKAVEKAEVEDKAVKAEPQRKPPSRKRSRSRRATKK